MSAVFRQRMHSISTGAGASIGPSAGSTLSPLWRRQDGAARHPGRGCGRYRASMATPTITVTPKGGALGAEVRGIDLSTPGDADITRVLELLRQHLVLFFPDQHLDDDAHLAFALRLGTPYVHPIGRVLGRTDASVEHIVDDADHPPFQDGWHTDVSWDPEPPAF